MGEPCFTDCDVRFTLEMQGMPKTPLWCKILCVSVWWPVIQQSESIKLSGEECQIGVWPLANPVTDTHKVEWGKQPAAGSNVRMLQWGNCQSVVQQAGIWLYWSFLQKMLVLMTKSDSSTFSSRLFVSQCNDQFQSRSWGQPGLEMNLTGHDPTLWYHCGVMIQCNAGWHQLHKSTSSYLLRSSKASGLWSLPFMFLSGGWSIKSSLAVRFPEEWTVKGLRRAV